MEEHAITCKASPIQLDIEKSYPSDDLCRHWSHKEKGSRRDYQWDQYHRHARFGGSFMNVRYMKAGRHGHLVWHDLEKQLKMRFKKVANESTGWGTS